MLRTFNLTQIIPTTLLTNKKNTEFSRIISAAVIYTRFRAALLDSPLQTIDQGYEGEYFFVNAQEKAKLKAIHASNLVDFATEMNNI